MKTKKPVLVAFWVYFAAIVLASLTSTTNPDKHPEHSVSVAATSPYFISR